ELVRWRIFKRTGAGLMAELGSHQLDACSIFLGKVHPLAVSGYGVKIFYHDDREIDDHVFVTVEFPGKKYYADKERKKVADPSDIVVVTYSSINTNSFEPYGECVMGSHATLVVEKEESVMLFSEKNPNKPLTTSVSTVGGGKAALDSSGSTGPADAGKALAAGQGALGSGPVSKGYTEEMEDFAYCIRMWDQGMEGDRRLPRCPGKVAMADAIIALTANQAMKKKQ